MAAILPLFFFGLLYLLFVGLKNNHREAFLKATVIWGLIAIALTELTSLFNVLVFPAIGLSWLFCCIIFTLLLWKNRQIYGSNFKLNVFRVQFTAVWARFKKLSLIERGLALFMVFIVVTTGLLALLTPPSNYDSMTYHLPRVMHWIQDKSVTFYPTDILRQLAQNPGAEYIILQFQVLSGTDYLAGLVQWFSMVGCLVGVSLIAKTFGADLWTQFIASFLCATLPMGILQASSTQTDYVMAFWLVCFVYFFLIWKDCGQKGFFFLLSVALGLAILTKATTYLAAFPFVVYLFVSKIKGNKLKLIGLVTLFSLIVVLLNAAHYFRNFALFGSPLGQSEEWPHGYGFFYTNQTLGIQTLVSNLLRNLSLQLDTPFNFINQLFYDLISSIHRLIGADINDPRTTWAGISFNMSNSFNPNEETTGNLIHTLLIFTAIVIFFAQPRLRKNLSLLWYLICIVAGIFLFCQVLTFQPWHSRLQLPYFVLFSPFLAVSLFYFRLQKLLKVILVLLCLLALPTLFINNSKSILSSSSILTTSRIDGYFKGNPDIEESYFQATNLIKSQNCYNLGLMLGTDDLEYSIWKLFETPGQHPTVINYVNVQNPSGSLLQPGPNGPPCAIFSNITQNESVSVNNHLYTLIGTFEKIRVFKY